MTPTVDRISGIVCLIAGLLAYFVLIPAHTERVEDGTISPDTMPNLLALLIAVSGAVLMLKPGDQSAGDIRVHGRALLFLGLVAAAMGLAMQVGLALAFPVLALAIMVAAYEKRIVWLGTGAVLIPLVVWVCVTVLLGRPLP